MFKKISFWVGLAILATACQQSLIMDEKIIDWQGHRGARGLAPENTIPAFLKALEYPAVRTLEMDLAVTKDSQLVISHEPWMNSVFCLQPDGSSISEEEEKSRFAIYQMNYDEVKAFDCGSKGNPNFPEQELMKAFKPRLRDMVTTIEEHVKTNQLDLPHYNMEIKSEVEWDSVLCPNPQTFARLVVDELEDLGIKKRVVIQSFDMRPLREVRALDNDLRIALLVYLPQRLQDQLDQLGFVPDIYSPYYKLVTANLVKEAHAQSMKVIPWTVNETTLMDSLLQMGVDGIITDYPDRIPEVY